MSNSDLDFSSYPKIVPSSPEDQLLEVQKRSQAITAIKDIMENLVNAMQSYVSDLQALDSQARMLEQQKDELVEMDKQIRFAHHELEAKEKGIDEQIEYIKTENQAILERKLALDAKEQSQTKEFESREKDLSIKESKVNEKLKQSQDIQEKIDLLLDQQSAINKAISIDRERKQLLDMREQKILSREARLERLESESSVGEE